MKWLLLSLISFSAYSTIVDKYSNFAELAKHEVLGQDYKISVTDRSSPLSIFAIHGGLIEPGSDELAQALADEERNLYVFEGLKQEDPTSLHITATRFDEPQALALASKSENCVSVHGYLGNGSKAICVGGNDTKLASHLVNKLREARLGFEVIYPCQAFPATHPKNIINRCLNKGVQLEVSQGLWDDKDLITDITKALKSALSTYP